MKLIYVAGPYRGKTHDERSFNEIEANIRRAEAVAIALWDKGYGVFCPHLNTCHFEVKSSAPAELYLEADLRMLSACDAILMLPGWEQSAGACKERFKARRILDMPVYYSVDELE